MPDVPLVRSYIRCSLERVQCYTGSDLYPSPPIIWDGDKLNVKELYLDDGRTEHACLTVLCAQSSMLAGYCLTICVKAFFCLQEHAWFSAGCKHLGLLVMGDAGTPCCTVLHRTPVVVK